MVVAIVLQKFLTLWFWCRLVGGRAQLARVHPGWLVATWGVAFTVNFLRGLPFGGCASPMLQGRHPTGGYCALERVDGLLCPTS